MFHLSPSNTSTVCFMYGVPGALSQRQNDRVRLGWLVIAMNGLCIDPVAPTDVGIVPPRTTPATRLSAVGEWSSDGSEKKPGVPVPGVAVAPMAQAPSRAQYWSLAGFEKSSKSKAAGVRRSSSGSTRREV